MPPRGGASLVADLATLDPVPVLVLIPGPEDASAALVAAFGSRGLAARVVPPAGPEPFPATLAGLVLLAPFLLAPVERQVAVPDAFGSAETQVRIAADAATVWQTLVRVPAIQDRERSPSLLFDLFGAPRPREAMLETAGPGGLRHGFFDANLSFAERITDWQPERRIAWRSSGGAPNEGIVDFLPIEGGTKVTVRMTYDPRGIVENVGDVVGVLSGRIEGDLKRFKEFIEARGRATGGWRGEIHGGKVEAAGAAGGASSTKT